MILDSEVEEVLYSQVHYASSLVVSENSTPGMNICLTCLAHAIELRCMWEVLRTQERHISQEKEYLYVFYVF